jgi:hypothetical protein
MSVSKNLLLNAALAHYGARRAEALAMLVVYFNNSVGIGDHSDILNEVTKWSEILTDAEDNIRTLNQHFVNVSENPAPEIK